MAGLGFFWRDCGIGDDFVAGWRDHAPLLGGLHNREPWNKEKNKNTNREIHYHLFTDIKITDPLFLYKKNHEIRVEAQYP